MEDDMDAALQTLEGQLGRLNSSSNGRPADARHALQALREAVLAQAQEAQDVRRELREALARQEAGLEKLSHRVESVEKSVETKAESSYVTSCLLTKANKSDFEGVVAGFRKELRRMADSLATEMEARLEELSFSMKNELALTKTRAGPEQSVVRNEEEPDKTLLPRIEVLERSLVRPVSHQAPAQMVELDDLTRQVEKLTAISAETQAEMRDLDSRFSGLGSSKANKTSVANAIHRKASKGDLQELQNRVDMLKQELNGVASSEQVSHLNKTLSSRIDSIILTLEALRDGGSSNAMLEGRLRAISKEVQDLKLMPKREPHSKMVLKEHDCTSRSHSRKSEVLRRLEERVKKN